MSVEPVTPTPCTQMWPASRYSLRAPLRLTEGAKITGVTGAILAGGESRRMGRDKSLLPIDDTRFIDRIFSCLAALFHDVFVVTNTPESYRELPCRCVPDLVSQRCALAGIHSALCHSATSKVFVVACDMPFISGQVIRRICTERHGVDVVVPSDERGLETLHALYDRRCIPIIERVLESGGSRIRDLFGRVDVHRIAMASFADCDPQGHSFRNINTPQEYLQYAAGSSTP